MNRSEAAQVLGVDPSSHPDEVRRAFRSHIGRRHPDRAGTSATTDAVRIIEAYTVLHRRSAVPPRAPTTDPREPPATAPAVKVGLVDADTVALGLPPDEAFLAFLAAADDLGELTYVDPELGLLEVVIQFEAGPTCSMVVTTQGRAERTDALCTIESLGAEPAPPLADVVALLASRLANRLSRPTPSS